MKVILMKDMENLGSMGDEVEVKDGYARNYLIPQKSAIESTKGALRVIERKTRERERRQQQMKEECMRLAERIQTVSCTIAMEAGEENKLFGSVTPEMIVESLSSENIEIDKKKIVFQEPLKALGVYNVEIRLHPEVTTQVRVWIVKK